MPVTLITGASQGIGLEMTRQYSHEESWRVLACCRDPGAATRLAEVAGRSRGLVTVHRLDVSVADHIHSLAGKLSGTPIDLLVNNAGAFGPKDAGFGNVPDEEWLEVFRVNAIAPLRMVEAFVHNVASSGQKKIATITSRMGSLDDDTGGHYIYRSTKAAVNRVMRSVAIDLKARGITCVLVHPGWVRTGMGGDQAPLGPEESVRGLRSVLSRISLADTGKFFSHEGAELPW